MVRQVANCVFDLGTCLHNSLLPENAEKLVFIQQKLLSIVKYYNYLPKIASFISNTYYIVFNNFLWEPIKLKETPKFLKSYNYGLLYF